MTSEWKECTIGEIATISAGGDKPKICSDIRTENIPIPIFSNGLENNGLYGYTDKAKIEGDTVTISARRVNVGTVCYRSEPFLPIEREYCDTRYNRLTARFRFDEACRFFCSKH